MYWSETVTREELLDFLGRMTDFVAESFGEDLELTDWLYGLKCHGDYPLLSYEDRRMGLLLEQRAEEERLRREIKEMEGLYEAADRK